MIAWFRKNPFFVPLFATPTYKIIEGFFSTYPYTYLLTILDKNLRLGKIPGGLKFFRNPNPF